MITLEGQKLIIIMKYYLIMGGVIAYLHNESRDANLMFNSIIDSIEIVKDSEGIMAII